MANILFKRGSYADFNEKVVGKAVDGALYLTEDEGGLYIGKTNGEVKRIQGSVIILDGVDQLSTLPPPYSTEVIYFLTEDDALVRWNGNKWIVLNATADNVANSITSINNAIDKLREDLTATTATANGAVQRTGDTMTGPLTLNADPTADKHAATKSYVDSTKNTLLGTSGDGVNAKTIYGAHAAAAAALTAASSAQNAADAAANAASEADDKAVTAQNRADAAYSLAGTKLNASWVDGDYATDKANLEKQISANKTAAANAQNTADSANSNANTRLLQSEFETFKTSNTNVINGVSQNVANNAENIATNADNIATNADNIAGLDSRLKSAEKICDDAVTQTNGGTLQNTINMNNNAITNLPTPSNNGDAANKKYVDDTKTAINNNISNLNTKLEEVEGLANTGITNAAAAQTTANNAAAAADKNAGDITALASRVTANENTLVTHTASINSKVSTSDFNSFKTENTAAIADAKKAGTDAANAAARAQETADKALPMAGGEMTGPISLASAARPISDNHVTDKKYVDEEIAAAIAENDAMTYKGVAPTTLPDSGSSGPQRGDAYKVGTAGTYVARVNGTIINISAKVGDLFINKGVDGTADWDHITSGYEDDYAQKLLTDQTRVFLTDGVATDYNSSLTSFKVIGTDNIKVNLSTEGNEIVITTKLEWESF